MVKKKRHKWDGVDIVVTALSILTCVITLYPMIYVFSCSISDPKMVMAGRVLLFPKGFTTTAYEMVLAKPEFLRSLLNSVFYVVSGCILMLMTTVMMAYPLTRPNLAFRKFVTVYLLIPMYFGAGMIPGFIIITKLGLYNTIWSLILPGCYGIWNIILCRTFMAGLPQELIEAGLIDGCGQNKALLKIVLPLSKPVLAVITIYTIVGIWNSWFNASIYTTHEELQPVQLFLRRTLESTTTVMDPELLASLPYDVQKLYAEMALSGNQIKYAMIIVTTLPIIFVYPMFQKHFTKGIMLGSLKG